MHNVAHEGATEIGKPPSMTDEECTSVWASRGIDDAGYPYFLTSWMPNQEDLKALNEGRPLWLKTIGSGFQPIAPFTTNEAGDINQ